MTRSALPLPLALAALLGGCTFDRSGLSAAAPDDGSLSFGDAVVADTAFETDLAGSDAPGADAGPRRDAAAADGPAGDGPGPDASADGGGCVAANCPLGCHPTEDRCNRLAPSNFDTSAFFAQLTKPLAATPFSDPDLIIDGKSGEISTGLGLILREGKDRNKVRDGVYWGVLDQGADLPELSVFGVASLDIPQGSVLRVIGDRAVAIYALGQITIGGEVLLAVTREGGPGGFAGGNHNGEDAASCFGGEGHGGQTDANDDGGGGGGGRGAAGGDGGDATFAAGGAGGSLPSTGGAELVPLYGGCGGAAGIGEVAGGGGGGALQLVSELEIAVSGLINAPGGGGGGGELWTSGGGGGAGGAILLEAPRVLVSGRIAANGGGGGAGASFVSGQCCTGEAGTDGLSLILAAPGGTGLSGYNGGSGGAGGMRDAPWGNPGFSEQNGGGGGGATGVIRINAPLISIGEGNATPLPSTSEELATW